VLGTSISGQAARTLGAEAGMDESRTIASLLWRIDHGQARLDSSTVVVCDEAGMCDDPAMLRLLTEAEAAGSKLVIVGDHRQLGAVGPGGSLQALVTRHQGSVHALRENVRQADTEERAVLAQLRAGNVEHAVTWYADHGRIDTANSRDQALDQTVAAWAAEVAKGKLSTIWPGGEPTWQPSTRGPDRPCARPGRSPGPNCRRPTPPTGPGTASSPSPPPPTVSTSQRGQVTAVHPDAGRLTVRTDDGQIHTLGPDQIGPDHLALGYATTLHRS
jgi:hypothetical protein